MKRNVLALLRKIFCLPPRLAAGVALPGLALCFVMLGTAPDTLPAYAAYLWGAYGLAVLSRFGNDEALRTQIISATGGIVCLIVIGMAVAMLYHTTKRLNAATK